MTTREYLINTLMAEAHKRYCAPTAELEAKHETAVQLLNALIAHNDRVGWPDAPHSCETCEACDTGHVDDSGGSMPWCDEHHLPCYHFGMVGQPDFCGIWQPRKS